ncbi:hypothetical protein CR513_41942, partial [Mucuna pruriens]
MLLLQEFDVEIRDKKGVENTVANHLSRLKREGESKVDKEKLEWDAKYYIWDDPYLWRLCNDQVIRRCIPNLEIQSILHFCYSASGGDHYGSSWIAQKVLDYGLY